jgi:hypothetical protein
MKNLKEIKLMMERLESPRLTETELNRKKNLLKEEKKTQCYEIDLGLDSLIGKDLSKIFIPSTYRYSSPFGASSVRIQDVFTPSDDRQTLPKITQFYSYFCPRKRENFPELKDDQFIVFPSDTDVTSIYVGLDGGKITPVGLSGKVVDVSGNAVVLQGRKGQVNRISVYQNGKYIKSLDDGEFIVGPKDSDTSVYDKIKSKLGEKVDPSKTKEIEMQ